MARPIDPALAVRLIEAIRRFDDGANVEQLEAAVKVPRRTLQRRLAELARSGQLRTTGGRKHRRYHLPDLAGDVPDQLALSDQGEIVRGLVRRPLMAQPCVS